MNREEILKAIDTLTEQAGGKLSEEGSLRIRFENLTAEIQSIQKQISTKKSKSEGKSYSEDSERLLDQTTVVEYNKKIAKIRERLDSEEESLTTLKAREAELSTAVETKKSNLAVAQKSVDAITERMNTSTSDEEIKAHYADVLARAKESVAKKEKQYTDTQDEFKSVQDEMDTLSATIQKLRDELAAMEASVASLNEKISNNENYINKAAKEEDLAEIAKLEAKLAEVEEKRNKIVSDPVIIGSDAKKALIENDVTVVVNKANALAQQAKENQYIEIVDRAALAEEVKAAEEERDRIHAQYDQKDFSINDNEVINVIKDYFNKRKEQLETQKSNLNNIMTSLDKDETYSTEATIQKISTSIDSLSTQIEEYKNVAESTEETKDKADLRAAYDSKTRQIDMAERANSILMEYQTKDILEASKISAVIEEIDKEIAAIDAELEQVEKERLNLQSQGKDILAQKAAFSEVQEKAKVVQNIKFAMKFEKTPSQILEEISQSLGTDLTPINQEPEIQEEAVVEETVENTQTEEAVLSAEETAELVTDTQTEEVAYEQAFKDEAEPEAVVVPTEEPVAEAVIEEPAQEVAEQSETPAKVTEQENVAPEVVAEVTPEPIVEPVAEDTVDLSASVEPAEAPSNDVVFEEIPAQENLEALIDETVNTVTATPEESVANETAKEATEIAIPEETLNQESVAEVPVFEDANNLADLFNGTKVVESEDVSIQQQPAAQEVVGVEEVKVEEQPVIPEAVAGVETSISDTQDLQKQIDSINEFFAQVQNSAPAEENKSLGLVA